jgi:hypothetical protein
MWIMRGDPAFGGQIDNLSKDIGILDKFALCYGPKKEIYFLSNRGFGVIPPGGAPPELLSQDRIPRELINVDPTLVNISMAYNDRQRGVHIFLVSSEGNPMDSWFYSIKYGAYWKDSYAQNVYVCHQYKTDVAGYTDLIAGCDDGYLRKFTWTAETDDGTNISSHVYCGPMRTAGNDAWDGVLMRIDGYLAQNSGDVLCEVFYGDAHMSMPNASEADTERTWTGSGMQRAFRVCRRGGSTAIKLSSTGARSWSVEKMLQWRRAAGMQRTY